jgi:hypothetical protein
MPYQSHPPLYGHSDDALWRINYIPPVYIKCNPFLHLRRLAVRWDILSQLWKYMLYFYMKLKKKIVYTLFSQRQLTSITEYGLLKTYCDHGKFSLPVISSTWRNETIAVVYAPWTLRHQWNEWLQAWHKHQKNGWYTDLWVPVCLNHYKQCHSGFFHEFLNWCSYLTKNNKDRVT